MGAPDLGRDVPDGLVLHQRDGAFVIQAQEAVEGVLDPVHPVERDQLHAELVGEELDLGLDVGGGDGEVVQALELVHGVSPDMSAPASRREGMAQG